MTLHKAREALRAAGATGGDYPSPQNSPAEAQPQTTEALSAFFNSLMKRDVAGAKKSSS